MKITPSALLNIVLTTMLVTSLFLMGVRSGTTPPPYDPWADLDDNGFIDVKDILGVALQYGATGDPTKNVNVTNDYVKIMHSTNSCSYIKTIQPIEVWVVEIETKGYRQITLGFTKYAGTGNFSVGVFWYVDVGMEYYFHDYFECEQAINVYDICGPKLRVTVGGQGLQAFQVRLSYYMTT